MPRYDYIEEVSGQTVELAMPIAQRDSVPGHRRIVVPPRLNTVGFAPDIHSQEHQVREGMKQLEHKYGASRVERESGFSANELKTIWGTN